MTCNVGGIDRTLRILAGAFNRPGSWTGNMLVLAIGFIPLLTGLFRFCPFYPLLKVSSCDKKPASDA